MPIHIKIFLKQKNNNNWEVFYLQVLIPFFFPSILSFSIWHTVLFTSCLINTETKLLCFTALLLPSLNTVNPQLRKEDYLALCRRKKHRHHVENNIRKVIHFNLTHKERTLQVQVWKSLDRLYWWWAGVPLRAFKRMETLWC